MTIEQGLQKLGERMSDDGRFYETAVMVSYEVERAHAKYGPYASKLEALGAMTAEFDEFKVALQARDMPNALAEAAQVATTSIRFIMEFGPKPETAE